MEKKDSQLYPLKSVKLKRRWAYIQSKFRIGCNLNIAVVPGQGKKKRKKRKEKGGTTNSKVTLKIFKWEVKLKNKKESENILMKIQPGVSFFFSFFFFLIKIFGAPSM